MCVRCTDYRHGNCIGRYISLGTCVDTKPEHHSILLLSSLRMAKDPKFCFKRYIVKQTLPPECAPVEISFEWSHLKISSTGSKVRATLYSIVNSTAEKCCSQLGNSFHLNGHTVKFDPQSQNLEPPCTA